MALLAGVAKDDSERSLTALTALTEAVGPAELEASFHPSISPDQASERTVAFLSILEKLAGRAMTSEASTADVVIVGAGVVGTLPSIAADARRNGRARLAANRRASHPARA